MLLDRQRTIPPPFPCPVFLLSGFSVHGRAALRTAFAWDDPDGVAAFETGGAASAGDRHGGDALDVAKVAVGNGDFVDGGVVAHDVFESGVWVVGKVGWERVQVTTGTQNDEQSAKKSGLERAAKTQSLDRFKECI